jgi:hypothetical protein
LVIDGIECGVVTAILAPARRCRSTSRHPLLQRSCGEKGAVKRALTNRRLFDDCRASSAGRSGARLCEHWLLQFSDWTDPGSGTRYLSLVPLWTVTKKLAEVHDGSGDVFGLFSKLQTLDRRVGVPFGWYFFMLHGNRVHDGAGKRVLQAAEDGLIVLPEHDYQVLRAWRDRNYGF